MRDFDAAFPKTVEEAPARSLLVYQAEPTNRCDATCAYCPHPKQTRPLGCMATDTFAEVLRAAGNRVMALHHFGEPLLNPDLELLVRMAADAGVAVGFSTNGRLLTQKKLQRLIGAGLQWCRIHTDPFGVRAAAFQVPPHFELTEHSIEADNGAVRKPRVSFSGAVDGPAPDGGHAPCSFITQPWVVVLWDGTIATCCHDVNGVRSYELCRACRGYTFKDPHDWGNYDG